MTLVVYNLTCSSGYNTTTTFWQKFCCPKCQVELPPTSLANQVKRRIEFFISTYYKGIMMCDDETCDYTTWSLNLHVVGESERGTVDAKLKATIEKEVGKIRGLVGLAFSTAQKDADEEDFGDEDDEEKDHQAIDILLAEIDIYELFAFKHCWGRRLKLALCEGSTKNKKNTNNF
ncbi:unnamed protein product [Lactuca saligna]|uniref:Zinc finger DNA-directed DNA polymerase family B alpha domain-containing protein n=1 Tax=Lactuca saligna TaxID=75948 RepID=A0AA35VUC9_LACSI|nr:unnamed protein product [Lactuca saligna]